LFQRNPTKKDNPGTSGSIPEPEVTNQTAAASEPTNTHAGASNITQSVPAKKRVRLN
jgi:hypothetical protein